jgi:hypothetical protein
MPATSTDRHTDAPRRNPRTPRINGSTSMDGLRKDPSLAEAPDCQGKNAIFMPCRRRLRKTKQIIPPRSAQSAPQDIWFFSLHDLFASSSRVGDLCARRPSRSATFSRHSQFQNWIFCSLANNILHLETTDGNPLNRLEKTGHPIAVRTPSQSRAGSSLALPPAPENWPGPQSSIRAVKDNGYAIAAWSSMKA